MVVVSALPGCLRAQYGSVGESRRSVEYRCGCRRRLPEARSRYGHNRLPRGDRRLDGVLGPASPEDVAAVVGPADEHASVTVRSCSTSGKRMNRILGYPIGRTPAVWQEWESSGFPSRAPGFGIKSALDPKGIIAPGK